MAKFLQKHRPTSLFYSTWRNRQEYAAALRFAEQLPERAHDHDLCQTCGDWMGWNDHCDSCLLFGGLVVVEKGQC
jgi:hypothetical protein